MSDDSDIGEGGLAGALAGAARREHDELIVWLLERGFSLDQIQASATPALLPAVRTLGDDGQYVSAREVAESTGVALELLQRLQNAVGLPRIDDPDAAVLLRADAQAATRAKVFLDMGIGVEETVALMRAIMASLGHVAALMREAALKVVLRPGATELELAQESQELANRAAPHLGPMLDDLLRVEMRRAFEIGAVTAAERAAGELPGARDVTVGFADVVGFTRLGEALPPEQLHGVASLLAKLARETAVAPVRFIKSIGDAVMFVSPEPAPLLNTVLDLAAAAAAHGLPPLRIGIASGTAVSRAGDWFGRPVNVASRVTATAPPGAVLVAESTHQAAADAPGLRWFPHGARRLKGVSGDVRLFRVTRQSP